MKRQGFIYKRQLKIIKKTYIKPHIFEKVIIIYFLSSSIIYKNN